jgi:hypothetical protein
MSANWTLLRLAPTPEAMTPCGSHDIRAALGPLSGPPRLRNAVTPPLPSTYRYSVRPSPFRSAKWMAVDSGWVSSAMSHLLAEVSKACVRGSAELGSQSQSPDILL